eukprot:TRINITY_DN7880_c0_g1_i1.p1 TRINITY_DN7880_c0_g1~~TRINITY_DN7880_c0_g1_i1.p1  ORF type:complete len:1057 (+),score=116.77 TRINITY_DN7880_c0_g1_i1:37-3171(+)
MCMRNKYVEDPLQRELRVTNAKLSVVSEQLQKEQSARVQEREQYQQELARLSRSDVTTLSSSQLIPTLPSSSSGASLVTSPSVGSADDAMKFLSQVSFPAGAKQLAIPELLAELVGTFATTANIEDPYAFIHQAVEAHSKLHSVSAGSMRRSRSAGVGNLPSSPSIIAPTVSGTTPPAGVAPGASESFHTAGSLTRNGSSARQNGLRHFDEDEAEGEENEYCYCDPLTNGDSGQVPPLNIVILIVGSRGDVQPFIAFSLGLKEAGHSVRIATHATFRTFVTSKGLDFYPLKGDPEVLMQFMVRHPDMITLNPREIVEHRQVMESIFDSAWEACTTSLDGTPYHPDVIIANPVTGVHIHIAEDLNVPLQIMFTMPWSATKEYMHPIAPIGKGQLYGNYKSYEVVDDLIWLGLGKLVNKARRKHGLKKIGTGAPYLRRLRIPHTYCMSPHLAPPPSDWNPNYIDVVGFWFLELQTSFTPSPELVAFLDRGDQPLYIGFGSIVVDNSAELSRLVVDAIYQAGVRAIVHQGWARLGEGMEVDPNKIFLLANDVPHDWLFPRCAAVCHHGGAGTTATGLRFGRPTLIIPFFGDQQFWGERVAAKGVGPTPIPHKRLTVQNLADAIRVCFRPEVRRNAVALGESIKDDDSIQQGVQAFHRKLPMRNGRWIVHTYENQRFYPLRGWCSELLPTDHPKWSDYTGLLKRKRDSFPLPQCWRWLSDWWIHTSDETDNEGWSYAINFPLKFHSRWKAGDCVRRRKWVRERVFDEDLAREHALAHCWRAMAPPVLDGPVEMYIDVKQATGLDSKDKVSAFVEISLRTGVETVISKQTTRVVPKSGNPKWNDTKYFSARKEYFFLITVWDEKSMFSKNFLGKLEIAIADLNVPEDNRTWPLQGTRSTFAHGTINLVFRQHQPKPTLSAGINSVGCGCAALTPSPSGANQTLMNYLDAAHDEENNPASETHSQIALPDVNTPRYGFGPRSTTEFGYRFDPSSPHAPSPTPSMQADQTAEVHNGPPPPTPTDQDPLGAYRPQIDPPGLWQSPEFFYSSQ